MICNYKIINDDTKEILIAVGEDKDWFIAEGFTLEGEIEEGFNGKYYLKGYAPKNPVPTAAELLAAAKPAKIAELKAERDNKEVEPIIYQGCSFDYDSKARERISAAIIALEVAGTSATLTWTTADDQDVKVTADDLRCVIAAVAQRSNALHVAYRTAKDKVEQATTVADIKAVTLDA